MKMRYGTVLVFKDGVSQAQAQKAVAALVDVLDPKYFVQFDPVKGKYVSRPAPVHAFNPEAGGPVWYIP